MRIFRRSVVNEIRHMQLLFNMLGMILGQVMVVIIIDISFRIASYDIIINV